MKYSHYLIFVLPDIQSIFSSIRQEVNYMCPLNSEGFPDRYLPSEVLYCTEYVSYSLNQLYKDDFRRAVARQYLDLLK